MRIRIPLFVLLILALVAPAHVGAQDAPRGQLYEVSIMTVDPEKLPVAMQGIGMFRAAAEAAELGPEWGWDVWMRDMEIGLVSSPPNMAAFDDEEAWYRAFQGTPGEELLNQAMENWTANVTATQVSREVWEFEEGWSYSPAEGGIQETRFGLMFEFWVKPGMESTFEEFAGELKDLLTRLGGPYPVSGFRTLFGDVGRATFVTMHDGWGDYYGPNNFEAALEANGMLEEWQALVEKLLTCITRSRTSQMSHNANVSFSGIGS
jgi:hypothetical protein